MFSTFEILGRKLVISSYQHQTSSIPTFIRALHLYYCYSIEIRHYLLSPNPNPFFAALSSFSVM